MRLQPNWRLAAGTAATFIEGSAEDKLCTGLAVLHHYERHRGALASDVLAG
jgi:hypothetical protein